MLLSSIEVQGFKSFADKTLLKFGQGITAVVGPNGSGKSNIADAVRWVLGEQSTKNLRGQSMEDVIFGGTATRRPHGYCEVTLNIDNSDRSLNFDNDFVSITRRYYRSHESEYLINNVSVRLKDINELFMDTGLGRDGYSMIGQGKIDSIISSKSQERRDIFEEASGISKYRYKKAEAEKKLLAAEENLLRLKDIMNELESRVGPLKEQSEKAEKFLTLADRKKELEIGLWLDLLANSKEALRAQENKINIATVSYNEINEDLKDFDTEAEQNAADFAAATAEIENTRLEISSLNEEIIKIGGDISVTENEISHKNETISGLNEQIEELKKSDETAKADIETLRAAAAEKRSAAASLGEKVSGLEKQLAGLLSDSESISVKIEELSLKLNKILADSSDLKVTVMSADSSADEIRSRKENIDSAIEKKNEEIASLKSEQSETSELLKSTENEITECQNALGGYELKAASRKEKVETLTAECESLRLDVEAKKRRIQILSELQKNMDGFGDSVKTVMADAGKGVLRGIHGPVSGIIRVDKEYSVAIETALGATIQHIVTETESDAKRAIEMLKSTGKGRATFLPVSSIKAREFKESGFEDMYGYIGMAPDLIECDAKYREIIKYLLGNTVVCEDLDSAVNIAKKFGYRLKAVSLDGQVVNAGGSLTGGSLIRNAGILSRSSDIKRLSDEAQKLTASLEKKNELLTSAKEEFAAVDADILNCRAALTTANEDKIRVLGELKRIEDMLASAENMLSQFEAEKKDSDSKIAALLASANEAAKLMLGLDKEKNEIEKQIDEMSGGRTAISAQREKLSEDMTALKLEIIENEKDAETLDDKAKSAEEAIRNRTERAEMLLSQIEFLKLSIEEHNKSTDAQNGAIAEKRKMAEENENHISELIEKRAGIEKAGVELRTREKERTLEREKISGELARLTERREAMLREYDEIISQLYDEYQLSRSDAENLGIIIEDPKAAKKELNEIKLKIRSLGSVNVAAIEEYKEVFERYTFMSEQIDDVEKSRTELNKLIGKLTLQMQDLFSTGFRSISESFSKTFTELFGGGEARLVLSDPNNILETGIEIEVKLPGKTVPSLDGLSGGEKALIALSIYFAIMRVNAPPFCFLDEVDTALDDINVERFADYMKRPDFSTQFICVTHRRGTMEAADMLYGVTMQEKGVTKLLRLDVAELEKKLMLENG